MARPAKPWWREQTGWWMVKLSGVQTKLVQGPRDEEHRLLAEEKFAELRRLRRTAPEAVTSRTADVIEAFLIHSRLNHAADTYRGHKYYCQLFAEHCGQVLARELKPHHVTAWVTAMQSEKRVLAGRAEKDRLRNELPAGERHKAGGNPRRWGPTSVYNARKTAYTVFSWAAKEKLLPNNPLAGMPRPKPKPRQRAITDDEFQKLHDNAGGPLQDVLTALYHTGARPKEIRDLVWQNVREDRWVLPEHKTAKTTGRPRVIFLNEQMRAMMERLKGNGGTHVFLNTEGKPWTKSALQQQVWRIKTKLGLADDLCAYLCRHGFGTRAVLSGVDAPTVAELMGHNSLEMVSKVYVHLADQHQHLKTAVDKIMSSKPSQAAEGPVRKRAKPGPDAKKPGRKPKVSSPPQPT